MIGHPSANDFVSLQERDRAIWDDCATRYEDQIVHGHPDVRAYLDFEEDLLDRLLLYLVRDCGERVRLHDVGCGSARLHVRYGRLFKKKATLRSEPSLAAGISVVSGVDFSAQMLELARRNLVVEGLESLIGSRLLLEQGSAFGMKPLSRRPLPVAVALCNTVGVMQGPEGAAKLFGAMRHVVQSGGIAMISAYRREAVAAFALNNYESTMDVSGQPRWLVPAEFACNGYTLVPKAYKRAHDCNSKVIVDVYDSEGHLVVTSLALERDPDAVEVALRTGRISTHTGYESNWYSFDQFDTWIAEHWMGETTYHVPGKTLDSLRGAPVQLAFVDPSGLLAGFFEQYWR
jgi:SAM-dependent methyltransferase